MTVQAMIDRFDTLYPNEFTTSEKLGWLNDCDGLCFNEVVKPYTGGEYIPHATTGEDLLVPSPYDRFYESYLAWKMYLAREEIDRYNNFAERFNVEWQEWSYFYSRSNQMEQKAVKFF